MRMKQSSGTNRWVLPVQQGMTEFENQTTTPHTTTPHTFAIDPEYARRLAADLADAASLPQPHLPENLESPSEDFLTALNAALTSLEERNAQLIADALHLADTGKTTADVAEQEDAQTAGDFDSGLRGPAAWEEFGAVI